MDSLSTEEPRKKTLAAAVTESEHWAVHLLAKTEKRDVSELMRESGIDSLIARGNILVAKLRELEPAA